MRRKRNVWTEEREAQLTKLRDEGFSAAQIGVKFGMTRNAVIGSAHRMGLPTQKRGPSKPVQKQPTRRHTPFRMPDMKASPLPAMDQKSDAPVALLGLEPHHCRWPVQDAPFMFCADTKQDGSSYCERHRKASKRGVAS